MKSKFVVGDLVRVYGGDQDISTIRQGVVTGIRAEGFLLLDNALLVHPKQCRRVIRRERRKLFIGFYERMPGKEHTVVFESLRDAELRGWELGRSLFEFVEARKKK